MSKSLGNVIAPQEITKKYGAEILRLWTAAEDYREDVRISDEIINRLVEAYRKLRNTARFLISNLYDFDPDQDAVTRGLPELDRWILHRTQVLLARCREAYENVEFHIVYHALNNFCSVDLSAQYLDIVKDRLYCETAQSQERRSAQSALYRILETLVHLMAPILSFTAEEIWQHMPKRAGAPQSIFMSEIPEPNQTLLSPQIADQWDRLLKERSEILKALEAARNGGIIGHSLDAKVVVHDRKGNRDSALHDLIGRCNQLAADVLIVSQVQASAEEPSYLQQSIVARNSGNRGTYILSDLPEGGKACVYDSEPLDSFVAVFAAAGEKCQRCWKYDIEVKPPLQVCPRCARVLRAGAGT